MKFSFEGNSYRWKIISVCSLIILFLLHLPFLNANPDLNLCCPRDAFESEGLCTIQLRNYLNLGYWSVTECDKLIKVVFFNVILFLPLKIFGTHLIVARLTTMVIVLLSVWLFGFISSFRQVVPVLCVVSLLQYLLFQYSHFAMPELMAISFMFVSVGFLFKAVNDEAGRGWSIFFACLFCALTFFTQVLFWYLSFVVPLSLLCIRLMRSANISRRTILQAAGWIILFWMLYYLAWVLPNQTFYSYVIGKQTTLRHMHGANIFSVATDNIRNNLLKPEWRWFLLLSLITFSIGTWQWLKTTNAKFKVMFMISALWVILESYKISFTYLPPRYLVSIFFSLGLMSSIVITQLLFSVESTRAMKIAGAFIFFAFLLLNGKSYFDQLMRRQFSIHEMNDYLKSVIRDPRQIILGSWATELSWESKSRAIPLWKGILNSENTLKKFPAIAVFAELQEQDSQGAFINQGIDLYAISDSVKNFSIGYWNVNLYWLKPQ